MPSKRLTKVNDWTSFQMLKKVLKLNVKRGIKIRLVR